MQKIDFDIIQSITILSNLSGITLLLFKLPVPEREKIDDADDLTLHN